MRSMPLLPTSESRWENISLCIISNEKGMKNKPSAAEGSSIKAVVMKFPVKRKMRIVALISRCKMITSLWQWKGISFFQALWTSGEPHIKSTEKLHGYCRGKNGHVLPHWTKVITQMISVRKDSFPFICSSEEGTCPKIFNVCNHHGWK